MENGERNTENVTIFSEIIIIPNVMTNSSTFHAPLTKQIL